MSFLSRLFGSRSGDAKGNLEKQLEKLEVEAGNAAPGYVGTSLNRAGDLALKAGQQGRAVEYYGRAIDAFLEDGQREAARGVANKIIRVRPGAVRTLCTLTWLDLAARHSATALLHLRDYVQAAKDVERVGLAASQIYEMARIVPESEFIGAVADALDGLDFSSRAEEVRAWVVAKGSPDAVSDPRELAEACLMAAVKSNERGETPMGDEDSDDDESEARELDREDGPEDSEDEDGPEEAEDEEEPEDAEDEEEPEEAEEEVERGEPGDDAEADEPEDGLQPEDSKDVDEPEDAEDEEDSKDAEDEDEPGEPEDDELEPEHSEDEDGPEEAETADEPEDEIDPEGSDDEDQPEEAEAEDEPEEAEAEDEPVSDDADEAADDEPESDEPTDSSSPGKPESAQRKKKQSRKQRKKKKKKGKKYRWD